MGTRSDTPASPQLEVVFSSRFSTHTMYSSSPVAELRLSFNSSVTRQEPAHHPLRGNTSPHTKAHPDHHPQRAQQKINHTLILPSTFYSTSAFWEMLPLSTDRNFSPFCLTNGKAAAEGWLQRTQPPPVPNHSKGDSLT